MYIYIDESGTHIREGEFSVALVYIIIEDLENIENAILKAENFLRINSFHWSKHNWKIRETFIQLLCKKDFTVKIAIVKNPFNGECFERVIKSLLIEKKIKNVVIDGCKPKWYASRLKKILRDYNISVKKMRTGNDKSFPCLRLADTFAGLSRNYWNNPSDERIKKLYKLASKKITTQLVGGQVAE